VDNLTDLLHAVERGDPGAADRLWPLVYDELRRLAAAYLNQEKPGLTLDATALVNEAYLRLAGPQAQPLSFKNRRHFFGATAQAMRRILVERARRKRRERQAGGRAREAVEWHDPPQLPSDDQLLDLHQALERLAALDPAAAQLVELRFFGGLTLEQAAECLDISLSTANRVWRYARAWIYSELADPDFPKIRTES
jgi:RNA polymerase sigma factor (TIGR02999 family)